MSRKIMIFALAAALSAGPASVAMAAGHGGGGFGGGVGGGGFGGVHVGGLGGSFGGRLTGSRLGVSGLGGFGMGHGSGVGTGFGSSGLTGYSGNGLGNAPLANGPVHFSNPTALVGEQTAPSTGRRQYINPGHHYRRGFYMGNYYDPCYMYPYHVRTYPYDCPD